MAKQLFNLKGMTRDWASSKGSSQYAYEVRNLRLTAQEHSTLLAYETEKGNKEYTINGDSISGIIVGYGTVREYLVIFTHASSGTDYIYKLKEGINTSMTCAQLYCGDLGFTNATEIDAIGIYENENIQKIYWIDGVHQPRVINVTADQSTIDHWASMNICPFDFVMKMALNENVTITKDSNAYGVFPAGTIQYVLCYSMDNGQQSSAFYVSPINYITKTNRGGAPGETLSNAFIINVSNLDTNFDNVIIYSVYRTSENGTPVCHKVATLKTSLNSFPYLDSGLNVESVDYSEILYLGGGNIVPYTMEQKNNTLFFGNIQDNSFFVDDADLIAALKECTVSFDYGDAYTENTSSIYPYKFQLDKDQSEISTYMFGELYKFGVIFQNEYGQWSNVLTIGPDTLDGYTRCELTPSDDNKVKRIVANIDLQPAWGQLSSMNFKKIKVVRLKDTQEVVSQGVVCPTVFNKARKDSVYAQSSWFFRPTHEQTDRCSVFSKHNTNIRTMVTAGNWSSTAHFIAPRGELSAGEHIEMPSIVTETISSKLNDTDFFVDWNILTFHSPEVYYDNVSEGNFVPRLIGYSTMDKSITSAYYTLNNPPHSNINPEGITPATHSMDKVWISEDLYEDNLYNLKYNEGTNWNPGVTYMPVYAWHRSGALGNQPWQMDNKWYGELKTKSIASLRISRTTKYLNEAETFIDGTTTNVKFYNDDSNLVLFPADANNPDFNREKIYKGEIDDVLTSNSYRLYSQVSIEHLNKDPEGMPEQITVSNAPISMKYKSTRHGIIDLGYNSNHKQIIPDVDIPTMFLGTDVFWKNNHTVIGGPKVKAIINVQGYYSDTVKDTAKNIVAFSKNLVSPYISQMGRVLIRKNLVDLYGSIEVGDYITIYNSDRTIDGINMDSLIFKRIDYDLELYHNWSSYYYTFQPVFGWEITNTESGFITSVLMNTTDSDYFKIDDEYKAHITSLFYFPETATPIVGKAYTENLSYEYGTPHGYVAETCRIIYWKMPTLGFVAAKDYYNVISNSITETLPYTYLVNLTREVSHRINFINSEWIVSGKAIKKSDIVETQTTYDPEQGQGGRDVLNHRLIAANIADAYFQRWDCLKTYPYSNEDPNQIVEIFSFMVQTRINIDGRYDINRGLMDNTFIDNTNFNLLNRGYTQEDNLLSSSYLDVDKFTSNIYPNQIMWTGTKNYGSDIDNWTHIIPTSTLDMDGIYGKVSTLKLWNDQLICFQDNAFARIQYNDRTAIATTTGVPIELANSGKVDGKNYISTTIGCSNKHTVQTTMRGLYFADSNTREIYRYGETLEALSKTKGFNTYFYDKSVRFGNMKTFYDPKLKDLYFRIYRNADMTVLNPTEVIEETTSTNTRGDTPTPPTPVEATIETLIFNEQFDEFTSIIDYNMKYLFQLGDSLISIKNNDNGLWKQFAGDYLTFYGTKVGYSIDLLCSEDYTVDKTFTNTEFRADVLNSSSDTLTIDSTSQINTNYIPFDKIKAWNEYQNTGDVTLVKGNNLQQKFRIWRTDIPRDSTNILDRIRNPWIRLKLWKTPDVTPQRAVIYDVGVLSI